VDSGSIFHYGSDPEDFAESRCDYFGVPAGLGGNPKHEDVADPLPTMRCDFRRHATGAKSLFELVPRVGRRGARGQSGVIFVSCAEPRKVEGNLVSYGDEDLVTSLCNPNRTVNASLRAERPLQTLGVSLRYRDHSHALDDGVLPPSFFTSICI